MNWCDLLPGDSIVSSNSTYVVLENDTLRDIIRVFYIEENKELTLSSSALFKLDPRHEQIYRVGVVL